MSQPKRNEQEQFLQPNDEYKPGGSLDPIGFERHVTFHTYLPPVDLAPFIDHAWSLHWDNRGAPYHSEQVMQRPYVDLFVSRQQSGIQGTFRGKRTYIAAGTGRIIGIRFRPAAFHAFWDGDLADLQEQTLAVQQFFPQLDSRTLEQVLTQDDQAVIHALFAVIRTQDPQPDANIELINAIIAAIETDESLQTVSAVANAFSRSERGLQQLFQEYIGIGIKWLIQRQRLLAAAQQIRETDTPQWANIAYHFGYSSQQHFITDFKQVLGKTPLQYKKELAVQ